MTDLVWTPVKIRLGQIKPWSLNPRMSSKAQAQRLIKSERDLGQIQTLAVSPMVDGFVDLYDGHQRCSAWLTVKEPSFEVLALQSNRPLTDDERRKVSVTLHTATGSWDWDALSSWSAADLHEWGMDKDLLKEWNNETNNLKEMLNAEQAESVDAEPQTDRAAELLEKWKVERGQLWVADGHRILCGDSTNKEDVERVMQGEKAGAVVTDPPYNVDKDKWDTDVLPMLGRAADLLPSIVGDGVCFWFCATRYIPEVIQATSALPYRWMFIWYPSNNMAHGDLGFQKFTAALVLSSGKIHRKTMQDLRECPIKITNNDPGHPTPKPLELIQYLVEQIDVDIYFDGFGGSGTTLVACHNLGKKCRMMEIEPKYVAVILERLSIIGLTPVLSDL